jgi:ligand-binding sensor domain-containing protein/signal transduction histidine kinase
MAFSRPHPRLYSLVAILGFFFLAARPALAVQLGDWLIRGWQTEHGLPQNSVTALLQTRDGYLWAGTFNGLARFDGLRFVVFDAAQTGSLKTGRVTCLFEDAAGTLWVGEESGDLARCDGGQWTAVPVPAGWPGGEIRAIEADADGALWLLHRTGLLLRLHDGRIIPAARPGSYDAEAALVRDAAGAFWLLRDRRLAEVRDGVLMPWTAPDLAPETPVVAIAPSLRGGLWIVMEDRVRRWQSGGWQEDRGAVSWRSEDYVSTMRELASGDLVIGLMRSGLRWYREGVPPESLRLADGLAHEWVRRVIEDREGNLWVGTAGGLNRLQPRRAAMAAHDWQGTQVRAVAADAAGGLWVGTEGAGLHYLPAGGPAGAARAPGIPEPFIWSALADRHGRVWAGTWGLGLFRRGDDGAFAPAPAWPVEAKIVTALYETPEGVLWAGTDQGLLRLDGDTWTRLGDSPGHVRTIVQDAAGAVWCGLSGGGLVRLQTGKTTVFRRADGLQSDFVWALFAEPDGTLWIGTFGGGLARWKDGQFRRITTAQGLPSNVICHLADDGAAFWISSYAGIFRVSKEALRRCADGVDATVDVLVISTSDGLATPECSGGFQPAGARTPDGHLWFPTAKGLAVIDPARITPRTLPPPVIIECALVDDRSLLPSRALVVPPGGHRVAFQYTGLSFAAPERVRFRHRLVELDRDWVEAGARRAATYDYLPPGRYQFQVLANNGDGVWSTQPASVSFVVQPRFWQTWWFRVAAVAALALLLASAYRLRMRQLREIQRVRFRIARDLHDEIGANLGTIALLSQIAEEQPAAAPPGDLRRLAVRTVGMLKEIVWLTNPAHDRLSELLPRLRETAREMLPGIACEFVADDVPEEMLLPPSWRHHLLPILKEALHNAAHHAHPAHVRIVLQAGRRHLDLRVEDDGCGFDPANVVPGDGLLNLQRRAADMRATLEIESRPDAGTTIHLHAAIP